MDRRARSSTSMGGVSSKATRLTTVRSFLIVGLFRTSFLQTRQQIFLRHSACEFRRPSNGHYLLPRKSRKRHPPGCSKPTLPCSGMLIEPRRYHPPTMYVSLFTDPDHQQKLKFNFPIGEPWTQPFVTLLNGETEEIILREREQLSWIAAAIEEARNLGADGEELTKLTQLSNALFSKIDLPGTKAQLKPVYSKRQYGQTRKLTKLTLVFKWGGEVCPWRPKIVICSLC